jgi:hypothetical protein
MYLALGGKNAAEAYRRSYLLQEEAGYFRRGPKGERVGAPLTTKQVSKEANALLKRDHIQDYIKELSVSTSDAARETLADQVRFGDSQESLRAANRILDDEDKLGFRDAAEMWADIMCEVGTEVVVPIPGHVEADVYCPHCFEQHHVKLPIEATVPMESMFPQYAEKRAKAEVAAPEAGQEVVRKSRRTSEARDARFGAKGGEQ